jgi:tRNA dimethylallyltransferase
VHKICYYFTKGSIKMKQFAIIGPTASGKSDLAIRVAHEINGVILSLDSLSIYQQIDIASAKPTIKEREGIKHFGIDAIKVNEHFNIQLFGDLYHQAFAYAQTHHQPLIIVGGTGFYLKGLIQGLSNEPTISQDVEHNVDQLLTSTAKAYATLQEVDPVYAAQITHNDRFRIHKALALYYQTGISRSDYFKQNPPIPIITEALPIYHIQTDRTVLKERIAKRTKKMIAMGLVDEIAMLDKTFGRTPNAMKAIGIKETLAFLDEHIDLQALQEEISRNTARLAKRQETFNRTQFKEKVSLGLTPLYTKIIEDFSQ